MNTSKQINYGKAAPSVAPAEKRYRTFEDLEAYKAAREFRKAMYAVSRRLPAFEKYELASQVRRAAVSLTNNIAEGHGRFHYLEQIKFCLQARGSLEELLDDINICEDESYLPPAALPPLKEQGWSVHRLINGYIRWLRAQKQGASIALSEDSPAYGLTDDYLDEMIGPEGDELKSDNPSTIPNLSIGPKATRNRSAKRRVKKPNRLTKDNPSTLQPFNPSTR